MSEHLFISKRPPSGAVESIYSVPVSKRATIRVICTNTAETSAVTVIVTPSGVDYSAVHEILSGSVLAAGQAITTAPIMVKAGDTISVSSSSGEVNFHATGLIQDA